MPVRAATSRRPGRPPARGADLRGRLLDAAVALIARQGAAATTLAAIARRARVTPALVHYYFGSRGRIVEAVFAERMDPVFQRIAAPLAAGGKPPSLEALVQAFIEGIAAEPWLPPIVVREVLSEGGALRARFVEQRRGMAARLVALVEHWQRAGRLRPDLEPRLVVLSMMSAIVYPLVAAPVWRELLPGGAASITPARLASHVASVLRHGLELSHA